MITENDIQNQIEKLGGYKANPLCPLSVKSIQVTTSFKELEDKYSNDLPESYKILYNLYGPFSFNNRVRAKRIDTKNDQWVSVNYFYSIEPDTECSIDSVLSAHPELENKKLFPVCDGELGDLICIDLSSNNYGNVYYWNHEMSEDDNLFLIADSFDNFILKLEVNQDNNLDQAIVDKIQVKASPELLEMLRKSGFGPKK